MYDDFDIKLLPYPLNRYANTIGVGNLIKLSELAGGRNIYIPKKDEILRHFNIAKIKEEYGKGESITVLAQKYGMSRSTIYKYLKQ